MYTKNNKDCVHEIFCCQSKYIWKRDHTCNREYYMFNRPDVARAVLQSPPWIIEWLTERSFSSNIFQTLSIPNRKSWRRGCSSNTMCHMSCVTCHMSGVTFHLSHDTCHLSHVTCHMLLFSFYKKKIYI